MTGTTIIPYRPVFIERDDAWDRQKTAETVRRERFAAEYYGRTRLDTGEAMTVCAILAGVMRLDDHPTPIPGNAS